MLAIAFAVACANKPSNEKEVSSVPIVEQQDSPVHYSVRGMSVVDSNVIWFSGAKGTLLRTQDGGKNWQQLSAPDNDSLDFRSITAFSSKAALIVSAGFPARVYKTMNAGKDWKLVYENLDSSAFMNSIAMKNEKEGIIVGDQLEGRHLILKTTNGGENWIRLDSSQLPIPLENENGFAASGSCIAVFKGNYYIGLGGGHSRVFSSTNGEEWKVTESSLITNKPSSGIYSIAGGKSRLMAVGGDYTEVDATHYAVISKDGIAWKKAGGKLSGYRSVVDYSAACDCWVAAGTNGIEVSYNHGETWEKISDQSVNTLRFVPKSTICYAANSNGEILRLIL